MTMWEMWLPNIRWTSRFPLKLLKLIIDYLRDSLDETAATSFFTPLNMCKTTWSQLALNFYITLLTYLSFLNRSQHLQIIQSFLLNFSHRYWMNAITIVVWTNSPLCLCISEKRIWYIQRFRMVFLISTKDFSRLVFHDSHWCSTPYSIAPS